MPLPMIMIQDPLRQQWGHHGQRQRSAPFTRRETESYPSETGPGFHSLVHVVMELGSAVMTIPSERRLAHIDEYRKGLGSHWNINHLILPSEPRTQNPQL